MDIFETIKRRVVELKVELAVYQGNETVQHMADELKVRISALEDFYHALLVDNFNKEVAKIFKDLDGHS